mgnify:CR=1 FL=1
MATIKIMGRPKTLSRPDESNYDYQKRAQQKKYKDNPEYNAKCKIKYYKKLYRDNEDFNKILETHKNVLELLPDIFIVEKCSNKTFFYFFKI